MMDETNTEATEGEILGYRFADPALLEMALTTPANRMSNPHGGDNQRLEFLGDAVLGLLAADRLYRELPACPEGELSERRTHLVATAPLGAAAERTALASRLRRNKGAAATAPNAHTLADAVEAVVGAAWLDGGLDAARTVFDALGLFDHAEQGEWRLNPKGELQRRTQAMTPHRRPVYETVSVGGTCHSPLFRVKVSVAGVGEAIGEGHSRKEAEFAAAGAMMKVLRSDGRIVGRSDSQPRP